MRVLLKMIVTVILMVVLFSVVGIQPTNTAEVPKPSVHFSGLPKLDEIYFKAYPGATPETIVDEFIDGVTDWIPGPYRADLLARVINAGHKVVECSAFKVDYIVINCRDYKESSGETNFPLNDSNFRVALSYIYGMDRKQEDIYNYVQGPWVFAAGNILPSACPYYNESIWMPSTLWDVAWELLQTSGYYVNPHDNWLHWTDGVTDIKIRSMKVSYLMGALYWERGPGAGFVRAFNEFISYIGAVGPSLTLEPMTFNQFIHELLGPRNFDIMCFPTDDPSQCVDCRLWLYGRLYSSVYFTNLAGINNTSLDHWLEILITAPSGSPEAYRAASEVQWLCIYELMPYFPVSNRVGICTVARDDRGELMNVIPIPGICCFNRWSWMTIHWKGEPGAAWPGGSVSVALEGESQTLNPWNESTVWGWRMLDTVIHPLLINDPNYLSGRIPWFATEIDVKEWISIPELGIENGMSVTFYLRQDLLWHDLKRVTAYDCVNNLRLMRIYRPPRYVHVWQYLVYEEADGPYKFTAYASTPVSTWPYDVAEVALLTPKHIADAIEAQGGNILEWDFTRPYEELTGEPPPPQYPFLTQLVGCGPYVFDYYDWGLGIGHVVKFNEFFVSAPVIGGVVGDWYCEPGDTYIFKVLVQNMAAKSNDEYGELTNATVNLKIYLDELLFATANNIFLEPFAYQYLGPYEISPSCGPHTIKVEVYDNETGTLWHTYTHRFYMVVREDLSTVSGDNPDCFIDVMDLLRAAMAYGSHPGSLRWDPVADVDDNFFVDVMDLLAIALKYGWHCP